MEGGAFDDPGDTANGTAVAGLTGSIGAGGGGGGFVGGGGAGGNVKLGSIVLMLLIAAACCVAEMLASKFCIDSWL